MTPQEINETREAVLGEAALSATASLHVMMALERLAELEAAVAFKGFDELPEGIDMQDVDVKSKNGVVSNNWEYSIHQKSFLHFTNGSTRPDVNIFAEDMDDAGSIGWRYPVGDLG